MRLILYIILLLSLHCLLIIACTHVCGLISLDSSVSFLVPRGGLCSVKVSRPGPEVIKLEFILKLKIKRNDWLLADTCPQAAYHCALLYSSFIT